MRQKKTRNKVQSAGNPSSLDDLFDVPSETVKETKQQKPKPEKPVETNKTKEDQMARLQRLHLMNFGWKTI